MGALSTIANLTRFAIAIAVSGKSSKLNTKRHDDAELQGDVAGV